MSKFANILQMLLLLKSHGKMNSRELADKIEVLPRMIRKYKEDLEQAGIYLDTIKGADGGYVLKGFDYLMNLDVKEEEVTALKLANMQLKNIGFVYSKEIDSLVDKINIVRNEFTRGASDFQYFVKDVYSSNVEQERKVSIDINSSIISKNKIEIEYFSPNSGVSNRIINPYAVISYKNSLYVVAYCEKKNELRDFKLSRIREYDILEDKFKFKECFSLKEYLKDNFGIYRDGKFQVKLLIYKPMSYITSEKIWVDNQKISWNDDESIIFEATMTGKTEIVSWIMSMGSSAKVLQPKELRDEVVRKLEEAIEVYK